jgi:serpin B
MAQQPDTTIPVKGQNLFGLRLARELAAKRPDNNLFISPLSVFLALAMTGNGAAGKTKAAMWRTLGLPSGLTDKQLNDSVLALTKLLQSQQGATLAIANALWASLAFHFDQEFVARCVAAYGAKLSTIDFLKPEAADTINSWVKENTKGMIPDIVDRDTVKAAGVILTNAIYFRGKWKHTFSKAATQTKPFHLISGKTKDVPMMHNAHLALSYRDGGIFESAAMDYEGSNISMQVLLPKEGHTAREVLQKLDWELFFVKPATADLDLSLPRFTMDFGASLTAPLKQMGMEVAFKHPDAEFLPMGSKLFYIGDVIHKTRLEVDEEGTIAAAATSVVVMVGSAMPLRREKKTLVFNRPFVVLLYENTTGTLLFTGLMQEP